MPQYVKGESGPEGCGTSHHTNNKSVVFFVPGFVKLNNRPNKKMMGQGSVLFSPRPLPPFFSFDVCLAFTRLVSYFTNHKRKTHQKLANGYTGQLWCPTGSPYCVLFHSFTYSFSCNCLNCLNTTFSHKIHSIVFERIFVIEIEIEISVDRGNFSN